MPQHLWKEGKRKCYSCKKVLLLNESNFRPSKKAPRGFLYICRPCGKIESKEALRKPRMILFERNHHKCESCGLENSNPSFFDVDHILATKDRKGARRFASHKPRMREMKNLQLLCPNCHRLKTIKDLEW